VAFNRSEQGEKGLELLVSTHGPATAVVLDYIRVVQYRQVNVLEPDNSMLDRVAAGVVQTGRKLVNGRLPGCLGNLADGLSSLLFRQQS
jgi:hypothetical protein